MWEQLTQTLIVCLIKPHLFSLFRKLEGPGIGIPWPPSPPPCPRILIWIFFRTCCDEYDHNVDTIFNVRISNVDHSSHILRNFIRLLDDMLHFIRLSDTCRVYHHHHIKILSGIPSCLSGMTKYDECCKIVCVNPYKNLVFLLCKPVASFCYFQTSISMPIAHYSL